MKEKRNKEREIEQTASTDGKNARILFFGIFVAGLFVLFMGYIFYFMIFEKEDVVTNPYNVTRQQILESRVLRGAILAADGERLAYTAKDEDGNEVRVYPYRNVFAHIIGFHTNGKMGLELSENYSLVNSHTSVAEHIQNDLEDKKDRGDTVVTSLNVELQKSAYSSLGVYNGAIIVTDVHTGQILAMVSKPDFDPNEIDAIWENTISDKNSTILFNRATSGQYAPGSTFKIFTTIEYMLENPDTWDSYRYKCTGSYRNSEGDVIHCYGHSSHGSLDYADSFARSCNSSFANIGMSLDKDKFGATLSKLLFNEPLPSALPTSKSKISMGSHVSAYDMLQNVIGQGALTMNPLHLNMITATIANGGVLYEPYVVTRVQGADGQIVKEYAPTMYGRLLPEELCANMTELMKGVCTYGTAKSFKKEEFTVAGKTGSAEFGSTEDASHKGMLDSNAWFTGFAPAENPEVAITVIVEGMGSGGDYAVPIAKRVLETYFSQGTEEESGEE